MIFDAQREPVGLWAVYTADRKPSTRNAVAERYEWLVRRIALRYLPKLPKSVELDDLIGAGNVGLLDAIEKFDATKNVRFTSYATTRIWGAMVDDLRRLDWMPKHLRQQGERGPSILSIDVPIPDRKSGNPIPVADTIPDDSWREDRVEWDGWFDWLGNLLPSRERFVILSYYRDGKSLVWIGEQMGITKNRASQFHGEILRRLKPRLARLNYA